MLNTQIQPFCFFVGKPQDFSIAAGQKIPVMPERSLLASSRRQSMGILKSFFSCSLQLSSMLKNIIDGGKADDISYQEGKYQEEMTLCVTER